MTPKKLSDSEKQEIASSYAGGGGTMASLAKTFGVSASTVSRILRQMEAQVAAAKSADTAVEAEILPPTEKSAGTRKRRSRSKSKEDSPDATVSDVASIETAMGISEASVSESTGNPAPGPAPPPLAEMPIKTKRTRKRSTARVAVEQPQPPPVLEVNTDGVGAEESLEPAEQSSETQSRRRVRRRSSAKDIPVLSTPTVDEGGEDFDGDADADPEEDNLAPVVGGSGTAMIGANALDNDLSDGLLEEDLEDGSDLDDDYDDEDDDYDDEDDDYDDEEDDGEDAQGVGVDSELPLEVLPFEDMSLPNPCYLVVDRSAELITCPLREFRDLGAVPDSEADLKTLPIFDNHRIARRFSARNQRVIKVPDSTIFLKTGSHLQAKKIARLLVDGRVYSL